MCVKVADSVKLRQLVVEFGRLEKKVIESQDGSQSDILPYIHSFNLILCFIVHK